jgi:hypothetical protein
MKTMTLREFQKFVSTGAWTRSQNVEIIERLTLQREVPMALEPTLEDVEHEWGVATLKSERDGVFIVYTEGFNYDTNQPDSFSSGIEGISSVWELHASGVTDFKVIDADGDEVPPGELADYLDGSFSEIDYSELTLQDIIDIDVDEDSDMETFTLEIDRAPSIRFTGTLLASTKSSADNAAGGKAGRWTELYLYQTKGGKYICHQLGCTSWVDERTRYSGAVCENHSEVIAFFGQGWLAKHLYTEAMIDNVVEVE